MLPGQREIEREREGVSVRARPQRSITCHVHTIANKCMSHNVYIYVCVLVWVCALWPYTCFSCSAPSKCFEAPQRLVRSMTALNDKRYVKSLTAINQSTVVLYCCCWFFIIIIVIIIININFTTKLCLLYTVSRCRYMFFYLFSTWANARVYLCYVNEKNIKKSWSATFVLALAMWVKRQNWTQSLIELTEAPRYLKPCVIAVCVMATKTDIGP